MPDAFLAIDWGTTNRRIYLIADGEVVSTQRDDVGARALDRDAYPRELAEIRATHGDLPVLLAGMVGSTFGWHEAPYVQLPAGLETLAAGLYWIDARTAIVPGAAQDNPADVMRGEEVQLLGAAAADLVPGDALLCQPGTHCKWARVTEGRIVRFATAITGELFALLRGHSILSGQLAGEVEDGPAFRDGLLRGADGDLQTALFRVRAYAMLGRQRDAASYTSGLLIGSDVCGHLNEGVIHVLADEKLGELYHAAITNLGGTARLIDSHLAFVAGILLIREFSK